MADVNKNEGKIGVLLINLGTPAKPETSAIRTYLREFLWDARVLDIPVLLRLFLLYAIILPFRPKRVVGGYRAIWQEKGSPLLVFGESLTKKVQSILGGRYSVELAMRYGNPSIPNGLNNLADCNRLIVLPLYPHYAASSTSTALDIVYSRVAKLWDVLPLRVIEEFYSDPGFVKLTANRIGSVMSTKAWDHILFSYHGLPQRHLHKSGCANAMASCMQTSCSLKTEDLVPKCYRQQCFRGTDLVASELGVSKDKYTVAFQSRLGRTPWITPYTDQILPELYKKGIRNLIVAAPSFVADCLETSDEISIRLQKQWHDLGGETLIAVPALNDGDDWAQLISSWLV